MLDTETLNRLSWRGRRGMLENDLLVERFLRDHAATLDERLAAGFTALMALPDNDLLDLLLSRREPAKDLDRADVHEVLALMRIEPKPERH